MNEEWRKTLLEMNQIKITLILTESDYNHNVPKN